ncbi:transcriptional regulator, AraC family [Allomuricauda ruestringensis DSM 13258]|uniref:Transcriptional regulator, AraC family n=1 Tax=Allomuricauda ruestringensis (strain DSM 13258 / CIP 107369 / LMG 19739 / B1) TaxID=886377 RepID=G2PQM5_ALLRU|nr:AraC family transcriptional regulator [Allomuricauda ruestringensis]AEM71662.1 transcriptional regulator, AraC family [Allomuricauda ruestringensis DSM 13258]
MGLTISIGFSKVLLFFSLLLCPFIHILLKRGLHGRLSKGDIGHFTPFFLAVVYIKVLLPHGLMVWKGVFDWLGIFELLYIMLYTIFSFLLIYEFTETSRSLKERLFAYKFIGIYIILFITYYKISLEFSFITPGQNILAYSLASTYGFGTLVLVGFDMGLEVLKRYFPERNTFSFIDFDKTKYANSGLSEEMLNHLALKLDKIMLEKKPHLENNLSLNDLATKLSVTRYHLSQIINQKYRLGFYDYVNRFRIQEAKKLFRMDNDSGVTEIGYRAGFNNRVSFYKAFKKFEGCTPTEYREIQRNISHRCECECDH